MDFGVSRYFDIKKENIWGFGFVRDPPWCEGTPGAGASAGSGGRALSVLGCNIYTQQHQGSGEGVLALRGFRKPSIPELIPGKITTQPLLHSYNLRNLLWKSILMNLSGLAVELCFQLQLPQLLQAFVLAAKLLDEMIFMSVLAQVAQPRCNSKAELIISWAACDMLILKFISIFHCCKIQCVLACVSLVFSISWKRVIMKNAYKEEFLLY